MRNIPAKAVLALLLVPSGAWADETAPIDSLGEQSQCGWAISLRTGAALTFKAATELGNAKREFTHDRDPRALRFSDPYWKVSTAFKGSEVEVHASGLGVMARPAKLTAFSRARASVSARAFTAQQLFINSDNHDKAVILGKFRGEAEARAATKTNGGQVTSRVTIGGKLNGSHNYDFRPKAHTTSAFSKVGFTLAPKSLSYGAKLKDLGVPLEGKLGLSFGKDGVTLDLAGFSLQIYEDQRKQLPPIELEAFHGTGRDSREVPYDIVWTSMVDLTLDAKSSAFAAYSEASAEAAVTHHIDQLVGACLTGDKRLRRGFSLDLQPFKEHRGVKGDLLVLETGDLKFDEKGAYTGKVGVEQRHVFLVQTPVSESGTSDVDWGKEAPAQLLERLVFWIDGEGNVDLSPKEGRGVLLVRSDYSKGFRGKKLRRESTVYEPDSD